jgi:phosphohistidine phosphatase SixA
MRLYLVQHGDAVPERLDPERPLSASGRREVQAVARLLADTGVRAAHVVHSGKLRAQQTAELLAVCPRHDRVDRGAGRATRQPGAQGSLGRPDPMTGALLGPRVR